MTTTSYENGTFSIQFDICDIARECYGNVTPNIAMAIGDKLLDNFFEAFPAEVEELEYSATRNQWDDHEIWAERQAAKLGYFD